MKKIFVFLVFLISVFMIFAEEEAKENDKADNEISYYVTVNQLIDNGLFKNKDLISKYAQNLEDEQILLLQEKHQKYYIAPILLNTFVGFGSGNFACGDIIGGSIHAAIDSIFFISYVTTSIYFNEIIFLRIFSSLLDDPELEKQAQIVFYSLYAHWGILATNRIASLISSGLYVRKYNRVLNQSLVKNNTSLSVLPVPLISPNGIGIALSIRY